ncbi:peptidase M50 [Terrarubrum flagellatum]|uniref:peptidase M50 n=1 Tax=Terrirubrum flagellatum TaxID=2895980 RepID=UPI0031451DB2
MAQSFLSSSWHRVAHLRPRLRSHVQAHRHRSRGQSWYVAQDEASGRYHRFTAPVYLFIGLMDGRRTVAELWNLVVGQLGDDAPSQDEIIHILSQLHAADLLQSDTPPDAAELFQRYESHQRSTLKQRFGNPLAIRFPVWDPNAFLDRTLPFVRPLFGWAGGLIWLACVAAALLIVGMNWATLSDASVDTILARENLILMAAIFPVLKALHEFGHGYAVKRYGGAVHEFGLMFLVLAPVPYVDASASTAFRDRRQRAFVAAAGMVVELFIAALATFVWALAEPGLVRAAAYNVMLIAGVSTVVFNANPLLRFDGYYILSDVIDIPNLGQRANRYWAWAAQRFLFGVKADPPEATRGERAWFVVYAPAAFVYRLIVTFGVALFVASQFFIIGVIAAIAGVARTLVWPALKALAFVVTSPRLREHRLRANFITFGGLSTIAAALMLAPFPLHTNAEAVVWLPEESFVRAGADGFVKRILAEPDTEVALGAPLFQSEDPNMSGEIGVLRAQVDAASAKLESEQFDDRVQADLTRQELIIRQASLARANERAGQYVARAGMSGRFVAPKSDDMPARYAKRGDVLGYVMNDRAQLVRAVVIQSDIDLVRRNIDRIEIKFPSDLSHVYRARIVREVPAGSDKLPSKALSDIGGGRLAVDARDPNQAKTLQRTFQFDLELSEPARAYFGSKVYARFDHGAEPLGWQWYRTLRQLFLARFNV